MLAAQVRSGLVETSHEGAIAVAMRDGTLVARYGDIDRPFYIRSSAKPFQAYVSQEAGADLSPRQLAIACASHRGLQVQTSLVQKMLEDAGLDEDDLGCPPAWPSSGNALRLAQRAGADQTRRIWHNCSGKHASFLRACVASGWPVETYLEPDHPLQKKVVAFMSEIGEHRVEPVGVDGCGAPVARTTVRALAVMFARLASEPDLSEVFTAMHRYPALVGLNGQGDTEIAIATHSVAKGGAAGGMAIAVSDRFGIGAKSWDGLGSVASIGAVATLRRLGVLSHVAETALEQVVHPPVLGGGRPVGRWEPRFDLEVL